MIDCSDFFYNLYLIKIEGSANVELVSTAILFFDIIDK